MTLRVIRPEYRPLVHKLTARPVCGLTVNPKTHTISFSWGGRRIRNRIVRRQHVREVGQWSRQGPRVLVDCDMRQPIDVVLIAFHESIEKECHDRYGLSENREGHYVAEQVERKVARRLHVAWEDYMMRVEYEFRREQARKRRR